MRASAEIRRIGIVIALVIALVIAGRPVCGWGAEPVDPAALVTVRHTVDGREESTSGRVLLQAADGGLLLESRDGQLVTVKPDELIARERAGQPFTPCTGDELAARLQDEFGPEFAIVRTKRYVIVTSANAAYGQWCGRLLERLQIAFLAYWKKAGLVVVDPAEPLVAVIFEDPAEFAAYATADAGPAVAQSQGYYSIRTNRIVLSNLTKVPGQAAAKNDAEILRRVEPRLANLTTVIHEATHQIAFNCGLHTRYADNPMWLVEGMAMFCEAPDLKGTSSWKTIGRVHPGRLSQFRDFAQNRRQPNSLQSLILTDDRFRDPATAVDAYAESWALTYFLIRERRTEYVAYLTLLSQKPRLKWDTPEQRETAFLETFQCDWESLERDFTRYVQRLR